MDEVVEIKTVNNNITDLITAEEENGIPPSGDGEAVVKVELNDQTDTDKVLESERREGEERQREEERLSDEGSIEDGRVEEERIDEVPAADAEAAEEERVEMRRIQREEQAKVDEIARAESLEVERLREAENEADLQTEADEQRAELVRVENERIQAEEAEMESVAQEQDEMDRVFEEKQAEMERIVAEEEAEAEAITSLRDTLESTKLVIPNITKPKITLLSLLNSVDDEENAEETSISSSFRSSNSSSSLIDTLREVREETDASPLELVNAQPSNSNLDDDQTLQSDHPVVEEEEIDTLGEVREEADASPLELVNAQPSNSNLGDDQTLQFDPPQSLDHAPVVEKEASTPASLDIQTPPTTPSPPPPSPPPSPPSTTTTKDPPPFQPLQPTPFTFTFVVGITLYTVTDPSIFNQYPDSNLSRIFSSSRIANISDNTRGIVIDRPIYTHSTNGSKEGRFDLRGIMFQHVLGFYLTKDFNVRDTKYIQPDSTISSEQMRAYAVVLDEISMQELRLILEEESKYYGLHSIMFPFFRESRKSRMSTDSPEPLLEKVSVPARSLHPKTETVQMNNHAVTGAPTEIIFRKKSTKNKVKVQGKSEEGLYKEMVKKRALRLSEEDETCSSSSHEDEEVLVGVGMVKEVHGEGEDVELSPRMEGVEEDRYEDIPGPPPSPPPPSHRSDELLSEPVQVIERTEVINNLDPGPETPARNREGKKSLETKSIKRRSISKVEEEGAGSDEPPPLPVRKSVDRRKNKAEAVAAADEDDQKDDGVIDVNEEEVGLTAASSPPPIVPKLHPAITSSETNNTTPIAVSHHSLADSNSSRGHQKTAKDEARKRKAAKKEFKNLSPPTTSRGGLLGSDRSPEPSPRGGSPRSSPRGSPRALEREVRIREREKIVKEKEERLKRLEEEEVILRVLEREEREILKEAEAEAKREKDAREEDMIGRREKLARQKEEREGKLKVKSGGSKKGLASMTPPAKAVVAAKGKAKNILSSSTFANSTTNVPEEYKFAKKFAINLKSSSTPYTITLRDNELLSIVTIKGNGKLFMSAGDTVKKVVVVQKAVIYDAQSHFHESAVQGASYQHMVPYPGGYLYEFKVEDSLLQGDNEVDKGIRIHFKHCFQFKRKELEIDGKESEAAIKNDEGERGSPRLHHRHHHHHQSNHQQHQQQREADNNGIDMKMGYGYSDFSGGSGKAMLTSDSNHDRQHQPYTVLPSIHNSNSPIRENNSSPTQQTVQPARNQIHQQPYSTNNSYSQKSPPKNQSETEAYDSQRPWHVHVQSPPPSNTNANAYLREPQPQPQLHQQQPFHPQPHYQLQQNSQQQSAQYHQPHHQQQYQKQCQQQQQFQHLQQQPAINHDHYAPQLQMNQNSGNGDGGGGGYYDPHDHTYQQQQQHQQQEGAAPTRTRYYSQDGDNYQQVQNQNRSYHQRDYYGDQQQYHHQQWKQKQFNQRREQRREDERGDGHGEGGRESGEGHKKSENENDLKV